MVPNLTSIGSVSKSSQSWRVLYDQTTGADNVIVTASGSWAAGRNTLLDIARSMRPLAESAAMTVDNVEVEIMTVSGGAGGAFGGFQPWGGFPGIVRVRRFPLNQLPDTSISFVVGAGGTAGNGGGQTSVGGTGDRHRIISAATLRGGNSPAEQLRFDNILRSYGLSATLPVIFQPGGTSASNLLTAFDFAWHSGDGPGGGGIASRDAATASGTKLWSRYGGQGSRVAPCGPTNSGAPVQTGSGANGANHNSLYFESMGGGGAAMESSAYQSGNGGFPGGGGGSGHSDGSGTTAGSGANGCIKLRFHHRESK